MMNQTINISGNNVMALMKTKCGDKYDFADMFCGVIEGLTTHGMQVTNQKVANIMDILNMEYGSEWDGSAIRETIRSYEDE